VPAQTNPFCMPELAAARAGVAAPNGGSARVLLEPSPSLNVT
jgi:hypothetical protein